MIGPLYLSIATYVSLLNNICTSWYLLTLTQMTLVKVLMIFKWSFMTGIDDNFVGGFLILVNVGFLSLSQIARHWLGSMYESQEFHMLSGKICIYSDAASGWAEWALDHPEFGSSFNPTPTRGAGYAHHITACQPRFENLTTSLIFGMKMW